MPHINQFKCSACTFRLPSGWGGAEYVTDYEGVRVILSHPGENFIIERVLNLPAGTFSHLMIGNPKWWWSKKKKEASKKNKSDRDMAHGRCGFLSDCLCLDCLEIQSLDLARDHRECHSCSSQDVKSTKELLGQVCPNCKEGTIIEVETGVIA